MDIVERRILTLTSVGHFFTHFTMLMFPPLATTIARDLGIGLDEVFSMSFMMYLFYGLGAVPWGYVSDRWSPRLSLATGMILAGFGLIGLLP
jgi:FSR family fosmidomycin resistance protein-like MFS transporter